jgi:hypothetical protein
MGKTKMLHIRISEDEDRQLKLTAKIANMSVSEFIRKRLRLEERSVGRPGVKEVLAPVSAEKCRETSVERFLGREVLTSEEEVTAGPIEEVEVIYDNASDDPNIDKPLF